MLTTKRKPASAGGILTEEFMGSMGLPQGALAEAMGVQRKHVNEQCNNRRSVTAPTALILARMFGNSSDFWLNLQRRTELLEATHSPWQRHIGSRAISSGHSLPRAHHRRLAAFDAGGGRGIRTPGAHHPAVFKTAAINRSAIPPRPSLEPTIAASGSARLRCASRDAAPLYCPILARPFM